MLAGAPSTLHAKLHAPHFLSLSFFVTKYAYNRLQNKAKKNHLRNNHGNNAQGSVITGLVKV